MPQDAKPSASESAEASFLDWKASLFADPDFPAVFEHEAAKSDLWLQLVEARRAAGLTQAQLADRLGVGRTQVVKIERQGYDAYTLSTLRRYVNALGGRFRLVVRIEATPEDAPVRASA